MVKKSYNPFKMWGSYVIPILYLMFLIYAANTCSDVGTAYNDCGLGAIILIIIGIPIVILGFLIGWGIHSLLRKFSK